MITITHIVYTAGHRMTYFSDDPSSHVWLVSCRDQDVANRRCPKKSILIRMFDISTKMVHKIEHGLDKLGLTDNMDDMSMVRDMSQPRKLHVP